MIQSCQEKRQNSKILALRSRWINCLSEDIKVGVREMKYQLMPQLSKTDYDRLKADIKANGVICPIFYDTEGNVLDGHHRLKICEELGITDFPTQIQNDLKTEQEKRSFVRRINLMRRHLTTKQKQAAIKEELIETEGKVSNRQIAQSLGVSHPTVKAVRTKLEQSGDVVKFTTSTDTMGRQQPTTKSAGKQSTLDPDGILRTAQATQPHVSHNSGNNEWYTPPKYTDAARKVLGSIDLDPASSQLANTTVKALHIYTKDDDGLQKDWSGNIWLNPPYAAGLVSEFVEKLATERSLGNVGSAIVLVNNATETKWFAVLAGIASAICFLTGRVQFWGHDGKKKIAATGASNNLHRQ